jgi:Flp pilus assembly protein TadG
VKKPAVHKSTGVLSRLLSDQSGNILAMTAAAVLPMLAVIGGAVDMSRIYMTRSRLQAACDAGVLAGRKAMTSTVYTTAAKARAEAMFNFNFKTADYEANSTTFPTSANSQGTVIGSATTKLPTVLMKIFGRNSTDVSVECSADLQVPNIDVVMVLDVTGSMSECPDGSSCNSNSSSKIVALRAAVKSFYTTLKSNVPAGSLAQIRLGFVPYSQAVNGSGMFKTTPDTTKGELPLTHLADTMTVQSRVANFNTPVVGAWSVDSSVTPTTYTQVFDKDVAATKQPFVASSTSGTNISNNDCERWSITNTSFNIGGINLDVMLYPYEASSYSDNAGINAFYQPDGSTAWQTTEPTTGTGYTKLTTERVSGYWDDNSGGTTTAYQKCTRRLSRTHYTKATVYKFTDWTYKPVAFNVAQFKQGNALTYVSNVDTTNYRVATAGSYDPVQLMAQPNKSGLTQNTIYWDGCMEERSTIDASNFAPVPAAAKDLNFLVGGTTSDTYWRTAAPGLAWLRSAPAQETKTGNNSKPGYACPTAKMQNLQVLTQSQVDTYADSLQADGYTYMDVGMIWGLRMIAKQGLFSYRNGAGSAGGQIDRHIIFLTDGIPVSEGTTYSAYAMEDVDRRITGSSGTSVGAGRHAARFQALCDAQRGSVSIWAIGFGTSVTGNLTNCADPNRALQANSTTTLNDAFKRIAADISDLRLVK